jgi:hypothetical protein
MSACQTVTSSGAICSLPEDLHDGRELDSAGYLHRFNQPINPERDSQRAQYDDNPYAFGVSSPSMLSHNVSSLLSEVLKFLDNQIIKMAQNGSKFPGVAFVNKACELSGKISSLIDPESDHHITAIVSSKTPAIPKTEEERRMDFLRKKYPRKLRA